MYDVAIIGAGPAGVFLAKHLDKEFRVIVIDKKHSQGKEGFHKPCGGLLAPDAQKSLSRFDLTLQKDILVSPQIFSVRTIDIKQKLMRYYQRHYINLDRHKFDQWLIKQIPKNVEVHENANCVSIEKIVGGYQLTYYEEGVQHSINTKYLVGADGAASVVRRTLFKEFRIHTYLSIQEWYPDVHEKPFYSCIFDSDITDSYAWGLSKDNEFIFGGAFPIKTAKEDFQKLKKKVAQYGFHLENPQKTEACLVLRPQGFWNYCCGGQGAFLVGEAAGFISPSSLEGISYAIDSGWLLAKCLNQKTKNPNKVYQKATRKIRLKLFLKTIKRPLLYQAFIRKILMKVGISAISKN